ncbi:hypothetical protein [Azorhizobium doebereinerae]|uniref:hypothetical protein n=1 Tax=Azorhizobium doebereinerae TaxID=281091 RepID=UPI0003FF988F|nr:hypothetical protein [Azorhizobium doebereinerae]
MAERPTIAGPVLKPRSWLFRFNVIAASLALLAVAATWVMIFREPARPPAAPPAASAPVAAPPVQTVQAPPAPAAPTPIPDATPEAAQPQPDQAAALQAAPLPLPRPALPATDGSAVQAADGSAVPLQVAPQPQGGAAPPAPQAGTPYPWPAKPPAAPQAPQAPRSTLPLAQRMGVPPSTIQQVPWLDGRTIQILVRALDRQPNETAVIEERPSGDIVRGRLREGPPPCRYMEIYPAQRSNAFVFLRFCPDALGRWMGEETGG